MYDPPSKYTPPHRYRDGAEVCLGDRVSFPSEGRIFLFLRPKPPRLGTVSRIDLGTGEERFGRMGGIEVRDDAGFYIHFDTAGALELIKRRA